MITKGIRGAITVDNNCAKEIEGAVVELLQTMIKENNIDKNQISHAIFTTTTDLNAEFPAKFARINLGWDNVAMMCFHELDVPESLKMCLRILIVYNCEENFEPKFVYLKGAANLRK
ncbi:chorismate mutase [bacterium]|nr:chorismate mutase [bacterium]